MAQAFSIFIFFQVRYWRSKYLRRGGATEWLTYHVPTVDWGYLPRDTILSSDWRFVSDYSADSKPAEVLAYEFPNGNVYPDSFYEWWNRSVKTVMQDAPIAHGYGMPKGQDEVDLFVLQAQREMFIHKRLSDEEWHIIEGVVLPGLKLSHQLEVVDADAQVIEAFVTLAFPQKRFEDIELQSAVIGKRRLLDRQLLLDSVQEQIVLHRQEVEKQAALDKQQTDKGPAELARLDDLANQEVAEGALGELLTGVSADGHSLDFEQESIIIAAWQAVGQVPEADFAISDTLIALEESIATGSRQSPLRAHAQ